MLLLWLSSTSFRQGPACDYHVTQTLSTCPPPPSSVFPPSFAIPFTFLHTRQVRGGPFPFSPPSEQHHPHSTSDITNSGSTKTWKKLIREFAPDQHNLGPTQQPKPAQDDCYHPSQRPHLRQLSPALHRVRRACFCHLRLYPLCIPVTSVPSSVPYSSSISDPSRPHQRLLRISILLVSARLHQYALSPLPLCVQRQSVALFHTLISLNAPPRLPDKPLTGGRYPPLPTSSLVQHHHPPPSHLSRTAESGRTSIGGTRVPSARTREPSPESPPRPPAPPGAPAPPPPTPSDPARAAPGPKRLRRICHGRSDAAPTRRPSNQDPTRGARICGEFVWPRAAAFAVPPVLGLLSPSLLLVLLSSAVGHQRGL